MIHTYEINGLEVKTGDIICTADGGPNDIIGEFWRLIGKIIPGDVDHIVVYVGPKGRCVEAGAKGVVSIFEVEGNIWEAEKMETQRGPFIDVFYGVAYPLSGRGFSENEENQIRKSVADYCLEQARLKKPYNLNFLNSMTDDAFYCSQLAYKAYLRHEINFNVGMGVPSIPGTESIVFPQEVWESCSHQKVPEMVS